MTTALRAAMTLAISGAGGFVGTTMGLPAGWIMGGAIAVSAAGLLGAPILLPDRVRDLGFILIGLSMGANVAPDSLSLLPQWPITLLALVAELVLIVTITGWALSRLFGLDKGTAYLSSFPGHLAFIIGMTSAGIGDARMIVIIQTIRIAVLTIAVPIGTMLLPIAHFPPGAAPTVMSLATLLVLLVACALAGWGFARLKVPAGWVLGAMAVSTVGKLGGFYDAGLPPIVVILAFVAAGSLLGSRFAVISRSEFLSAAKGGFIATGIAVSITTFVAFCASLFVDMPYGQIWVGLAPGALEGMGALGIALGYDTAFVAAHHVIRLLLLSFAIPAVVLMIRQLEKRAASQ
ncbi:AbrB family transcriptional regulator [Devosia pacifica]|nr:AbrB family transcriptional regulator [Devosia pacifica]